MIGLEWMERIEDETSDWSHALETEKGVVLIDLLLAMTTECDSSALNSKPAEVRADMYREK